VAAWFGCAKPQPIRNNTGGIITRNLGLVLHHQAGNGALWSFFNDPRNQVSAHFWVSKRGEIVQMVSADVVAWHGRSLNSNYVSVETEGCPLDREKRALDEPLTPDQEAALVLLYQEGHVRFGWPNRLANAVGEPGFGFHRMAVATACPCQMRVDRRPAILGLAFVGTSGAASASPPAPLPSSPPRAPTPAPPAPARPPFPGQYLRQGVRGDNVRRYQQRMRDRGWRIGVDGIFGPESDRITRQFQTEKRLGADGVVGPITWDAAFRTDNVT